MAPRGKTQQSTAEVTKPDYRELGLSGTKLIAGLVSEETIPQLQGQNAFVSWRGMSNDATGRAIASAIELPIRSSRWFVNPASDAQQDIDAGDLIHEVLWSFGSQSFDDVARLALSSLRYGFNVCEIVYSLINHGQFKGKIGWDNLAYRQQNTKWRWNTDWVGGRRQLVSMSQLAPPYYREIDIPRNKFLLWVNDLEGDNYDGNSIFRAAYKDYFLRDRLYRIRAIGLERAFMSVPVITLPDAYSKEQEQLARQIVTTMRADEQAGVTTIESMPVDLKNWTIQGNEMDSAINYHNRQMMLSALAQFLDLGSTSQTGSFALSSDQSELFISAINSKANYLAQVMNQEPGIPSLIQMNFANTDRSKMPILEHGDIGQRALDSLGRTLMALAQFGFLTPDDNTEDRLRQMLNLPEREQNVSADALRDLIPETFPQETTYGVTAHGARLPSPLALQQQQMQMQQKAQQAGAGGGPGAAGGGLAGGRGSGGMGNSGLGNGRGPQPGGGMGPGGGARFPSAGNGAGGAGARAPVGQRGGFSEEELVRYSESVAQFNDLMLRRQWARPKGRPTEETRKAMRATEMYTEALDDFYSSVEYQRTHKPMKPSEMVAKLRRPYQVSNEAAQEMKAAEFAEKQQDRANRSKAVARKYQPRLADVMRPKVKVLRP